jgi:PKD repeat protein
MGLGSRDLAILSARFDVARFGASRFGFCPRDVEGASNDEPGEYVWKEDPPPTTAWTLADHNCYCGDPPVASFTATPDTGAAPLTVVFADTSTGTVSHWYWEFGDGSTSQLQNPTHIYASDGTYTVSLWVSGAGGSDGPAEDTITATVALGNITGEAYLGVQHLSDIEATGTLTTQLYDDDDVLVDTHTLVCGGGAGDGLYSFLGITADSYYVVCSWDVAPGYAGTSTTEAVAPGATVVIDASMV